LRKGPFLLPLHFLIFFQTFLSWRFLFALRAEKKTQGKISLYLYTATENYPRILVLKNIRPVIRIPRRMSGPSGVKA